MADWDLITEEMRALSEGKPDAWAKLLTTLTPELVRLARYQPIGRLRSDEDTAREVATRVIAKLHANDHAAVHKLFAMDTPPKVGAWIRVLVRSSAIDLMRQHPEYKRANQRSSAGWVSLATLGTRDGMGLADSLVGKRREVENFMELAIERARELIEQDPEQAAELLAKEWKLPILHTRRLVKKAELYEGVLRLILAGHSQVDIAKQLETSGREVELVIGYIEELCQARGFAD